MTERPTAPLLTPFGMVTSEQIAHADAILDRAKQAFPDAPDNFILGLALGRLIERGMTKAHVLAVVDTLFDLLPTSEEPS